ncbi:DUF3078 domain-containing protein [Flavobacterium sp. TMP13]|uniref:DUF3078 domain-containing protein n=1 Tax=unclassified Flavobacterium TaxID=196869 RepID=UPI00076DC6CD|nr:DUF3078 domain-containing protein [Flavobacterium sp. TAB 87]KVV13839.1 hypothetical protein AP058_03208 [Flavobacterium sp. TAB 87]
MKLVRYSLLVLSLLFCTIIWSQEVIIRTKLPESTSSIWSFKNKMSSPQGLIIQTQLHDSVSNWTKKNKLGFDISEIAFVNWSAGGTSSISGLFKSEFTRVYINGNHKWANELLVKYGLNKQDGTELRKTDDALVLNSTYGFRSDSTSNWFYSGKFNFNTQFTNGYKYPNKDTPISSPFAPAYIFLGAGAENASKDRNRVFYFSPITLKTTLVLDQYLANQGSFGVKKAIYDVNGNLISPGEKVKAEFGILGTAYLKKEIFKNMVFENRLSLYTDYLNKFGNIDVDYETKLDLVVNEYVRANIGFHLIYDDDIKNKIEVEGKQITEGPKAQLRQVLGVGVVYAFQ